jgi:hypothetical protein
MHRRRGCALLPIVALAMSAAAEPADEAESLVRSPYFEGIPYDTVKALGPGACARLLALLGDPEAATTHANAIEVIGILACDGAYEAVAGYATKAGAGEVDPATFRALQTCSWSMGRLAAADDRALAWLLARAGTPGAAPAAPTWRFREHHGARLAADERRRAMNGLALSGRPEAAQRLEALTRETEVEAQARQALALLEALRAADPSRALELQPGRKPGD